MRILEDSVVSETNKFLEVGKEIQVRFTTAMQCANMNDHKDIGLVLDMRSKTAFNQCSINKSINFPIETFTERNFIDWKK